MEYSILKFTLFLSFIKYLLTKTCFPVYSFSIHCGKCIIILLIAFSPSFLPSQFDFLSVRDALPQVRSWLRLRRQGVGPGRCLSCRQIQPGCPLVGSPTQKVIHASCLQDQALRVQTAVLSPLWFLDLAAHLVTLRDILWRWQHRSLEGEMRPDAQEACKSGLNCLPRFASALLGDGSACSPVLIAALIL